MSARLVGILGFLVGIVLACFLIHQTGQNWRHPVIWVVFILEAVIVFWFMEEVAL